MINNLRKSIKAANLAYRKGTPIISDSEFDKLIEQLRKLSPSDKLLSEVGYEVESDERKQRIPIEMASMDKIKSMDEASDWCRLKGIKPNSEFVLTPKLDGLSFCVDEDNDDSFTRGDGKFGQKSNEHYKLISNHKKAISFDFTYGEVIMPKSTFEKKYKENFANPRNLVAGLLNSKDVRESLSDCLYIRYGGISDSFTKKSDILNELNKFQEVKIQFHLCKMNELTEELLISLFKKWSVDFEIDGIIIEVNDIETQNKLGRETSSNNPVWARAFKHDSFTESSETEVVGITWNVSKQGYLKPIINVKPIRLDGVTVSNVTGNNAKFIKENRIGVGSIIKVIRSGMVIPKVVDVITAVDFEMPKIEGVSIDWNENEVELVTLSETDDQKIKKIVSFFEILEAKNISSGVINQLWESGYKTIKEILELTPNELEKLEGFGKRKAKIVYDAIKSCIKDVTLSKLQHATGIFSGLGSKKLLLLEHFTTKPTVDEVMSIEGFAEISAKTYVDSYDKFFDFIKDLPINIKSNKKTQTEGDLLGKTFVFTGVRRPDLVNIIESKGGSESSSISKNTSYLVMKSKGSGSSKESKALSLGVEIIDINELETLLNN